MQIPRERIFATLRSLGIEHTDRPNSGGWIKVKCVFHRDQNLGSSFMNVDTSIFKCRACGTPSNLLKIVEHEKRCTTAEAFRFIGVESGDRDYSVKKKEVSEPRKVIPVSLEGVEVREFDPKDYKYTRDRGWTPEFLKRFGIGRAYGKLKREGKEGPYEVDLTGYACIPIPEAQTYEFRKIMEYECLHEAFPEVEDLKELRKLYDNHQNKKDLKYYRYLSRPRTYYPDGSLRDKMILWNQGCNREIDLDICEGIAGIPKIWRRQPNVVATLGSEITPAQIKILQEFQKRKIYNSDNDVASVKMALMLAEHVENSWVRCLTVDDSRPEFDNDYRTAEVIEASRYYIRNKWKLRK